MDKEELKNLLKEHLKIWININESMYDDYKFSVRIEFDGELVASDSDSIFISKD